MNFLNGIQNFLMLVNEHWTEITVIIGLLLILIKRVEEYIDKTDEEKIDIAKKQLNETILKLVTDAEMDYQEWIKAGAVKRAQVIEKNFVMYPILAKITNQEDLIVWIDEMIDNALKTMRDILSNNEKTTSEIVNG